MRFLRRLAAVALAAGIAVYCGIAGYMAWNQRGFLYRVAPEAAPVATAGLARASETRLRVAEGVELLTWVVEPEGEGRPVYVYFHGNAGTLQRRAVRFRLLTEDGSGLFAIHYRGYGGSTGKPTEADLHADARRAYAEAERRFPGRRLVIFGESLGSGVAVNLASEKPAAALILDSPYVSVLDRAWNTYPWLPVPLLLVDTFRSDQWIDRVRAPLLILHGEKDRVVPFAEGRKLFSLAREPKQFLAYPEAGHVDAFRFGAIDGIRAFLKEKAGLPG